MTKKLNFKIVTPERLVHEAEVDSVSVMTELGEVTILPGHIPLVANLVPGELRLKQGNTTRYLACAGGFLEVRPGNEVVILADEAEHAEEIDVAAAEQAREKARQLMSEKVRDASEFAAAQAALERALARLRVARRKKYKDVGAR